MFVRTLVFGMVSNMYTGIETLKGLHCRLATHANMFKDLNKRPQRALGRSPEEKVKCHSGAICCPPNIGRGPLDDVIHQI